MCRYLRKLLRYNIRTDPLPGEYTRIILLSMTTAADQEILSTKKYNKQGYKYKLSFFFTRFPKQCWSPEIYGTFTMRLYNKEIAFFKNLLEL